MSPLPDRSSQPPKPPLSDQTTPSEQPPASHSTPPDASTANKAAVDRSSAASNTAAPADPPEPTPLVPKRPLMRPVSRPQPPATPPAAQKAAEVVAAPKPEATPIAATAAVPTIAAKDTSEPASDQALIRQQPIPPPSEPKQYRAIGLVRGRYTPSDEQFTRGAMITSEGTEVEAVLLGRVMSLVRNHLDLEQEHLWVVYPRTREMRQDLHVQIVGVWEPEKLNKNADDDADTESDVAAEPSVPSIAVPAATAEDLGFDENYFSIRGEVVFYSADDQQIVVKIQQAPRKSADREKAFKLKLDGVLGSPKAIGYFWDLHVERRGPALVVTSGTAIGLIPPKKKTASSGGFKRGGDRRPPQRKAPAAGVRSAGPVGAPRREPIPKPVKRTEQSSDS